MLDIKTRVFEVISVETCVPIDSLSMEQRLFHDCGFDELDSIEIEFGLEIEFDVAFEEDEFSKAETVGDLIRLVEHKLKERKIRL